MWKPSNDGAKVEQAAREELQKELSIMRSLASHPGWEKFAAALQTYGQKHLLVATGSNESSQTFKCLGMYAAVKDMGEWPLARIAQLEAQLAEE
jgi:hypothetical protein